MLRWLLFIHTHTHTHLPLPLCRVLLRHSNNSWYSPSPSFSLSFTLSLLHQPLFSNQPKSIYVSLTLLSTHSLCLSFIPDRVQDKSFFPTLFSFQQSPRNTEALLLCLFSPCASFLQLKSFVNVTDYHSFCVSLNFVLCSFCQRRLWKSHS